MGSFSGRVALVTGGGTGIGRAAAVAFAREGAKVAVAGRRMPEGEETVRLVRQAGGEGLFVRTDVTIEADVAAMAGRVIDAFGRLDFAFNNAGVGGEAPALTDQTEDQFDRNFSTNVKGVWLCLKHEIARMAITGGGAIVNNASCMGLVGNAFGPLYTASKHAVVGLTKAAALQYARAGVRINAVCPGVVRDTEMFAGSVGASEQVEAFMTGLHPIGRFATPEEVAAAVVWLCSPGAGFVTGHPLAVDGGYTAQ